MIDREPGGRDLFRHACKLCIKEELEDRWKTFQGHLNSMRGACAVVLLQFPPQLQNKAAEEYVRGPKKGLVRPSEPRAPVCAAFAQRVTSL